MSQGREWLSQQLSEFLDVTQRTVGSSPYNRRRKTPRPARVSREIATAVALPAIVTD